MRFDDEADVLLLRLTSKMIVLRGGVERDRGPWGWRSLVFESYEVALRDNEIDDGVCRA
jgi:hypothetical protein